MGLTDQKSKSEKSKVYIIRLLKYIYEKNSVCCELSVHLLEIYLEVNLEGWIYLERNSFPVFKVFHFQNKCYF